MVRHQSNAKGVLLMSLCMALSMMSGAAEIEPLETPPGFPAFIAFSPVPEPPGWTEGEEPADEAQARETVDNLIDHGFTGLQAPLHLKNKALADCVLDYAQSRGMMVTWHLGPLEGFGRLKPPETSVYSPDYPKEVRARAETKLPPLADIPRLHSVFCYQDEPFHWGTEVFGGGPLLREEFRTRYGYGMPGSIEEAKAHPRHWLDWLNFQSDFFPDGWRQVYAVVKDMDPTFEVIMTHDSHNSLGAGVTSHSEIALDDVFHWGGDYADIYVYDLYPYMMFDFRLGQPSVFPKPRMSQLHYTLAQMRNLARANNRRMGFWAGTYHPAWFGEFLDAENQAAHWAERETATTAVAAGADFLLTGLRVPLDAKHWESFGQGMRLIQKAGADLLDTRRPRARAAMLWPRTNYLLSQKEYFNVGIAFELLMRAFGELDIIHEEQITDASMNGYDALVLLDVEYLPKDAAWHIATFVREGGILIADCVPHLDETKRPLGVLESLTGLRRMDIRRVKQIDHWVPQAEDPFWHMDLNPEPVWETTTTTGALEGKVWDWQGALPLVSPRPSEPGDAEVLLELDSGHPALAAHKVGRGRTYVFGFCLQDTYFAMWRDEQPEARDALRNLVEAVRGDAGLDPHVWSSNPAIEAAVRVGADRGYLFLINHETEESAVSVRLADLGFPVERITDLATGEMAGFNRGEDGSLWLEDHVPWGETALFRLAGSTEASS